MKGHSDDEQDGGERVGLKAGVRLARPPGLSRRLEERQQVRSSASVSGVPDASSGTRGIGGLDAPGESVPAIASDTAFNAGVCISGVETVGLATFLGHTGAVGVRASSEGSAGSVVGIAPEVSR